MLILAYTWPAQSEWAGSKFGKIVTYLNQHWNSLCSLSLLLILDGNDNSLQQSYALFNSAYDTNLAHFSICLDLYYYYYYDYYLNYDVKNVWVKVWINNQVTNVSMSHFGC